jgi:hypothetical protein
LVVYVLPNEVDVVGGEGAHVWACLGCGFDDVGPPFGATIGPASFVAEFLELDEQSSREELASEVLGVHQGLQV